MKNELKDIKPAFEVTDEAVDNMGCIFAYELRAQGIERLYTEEQLEQAEQIGMQRIWDLLPESYQKEFLSSRDEVIKEHLKIVEAQDEEV